MWQAIDSSDVPSGRGLVEGTARVVSVDGDTAWLEPEQTTSCGTCVSAKACGAKSGHSAGWLVARRFAVDNDYGLEVGDRVVIGISDQTLLRASMTAYGLPLLSLFAAGFVAKSMGGGDAVCAAAAIGGLLFGMVAARLRARRLSERGELAPRFLRRAPAIVPPDGACNTV